MTTQMLGKPGGPAVVHRTGTMVAAAGIAYTVSWIAGLSVPVPSPGLTASGPAIASAMAGHGAHLIANFVLCEGLPAIGLAVVSAAIARAIRARGAAGAGRIAMIAGAIAAAVSLVQCLLGVALAGVTAPGTAGTLFELVNRLDGVKMLALAGLAVTVAITRWLPAWLRCLSWALAISILGSGVVYLFLLDSMAVAAYLAGVLLLAFIPATAIALRRAGGR